MDADVLTWPELTDITEQLAAAVAADAVPDVIVGILRGGMVPAVLLAHRLGVRDVRALPITHTRYDGVNAPKTERPMLAYPGSVGRLEGRDVLVVDDVMGSGETLEAACGHLAGQGARRIRSAICLRNRANQPVADTAGAGDDVADDGGGDARTPTYLGREIQRWVVFPWEQP
ncbi:hypothetical protein MXD59_21280 [Frankia sp. Ag45/Mut15]|uniref:Phosphoribosyltransferase domain-containing protein n=1 Tax=Frankia umida TaxID=573489 RepID=A0ABT0K3F7_9ACTN|nr:phosphoribosyltransferase family protein [Frankia umida]MCK9878271.1 hypothetical protein [Frankia umida]